MGRCKQPRPARVRNYRESDGDSFQEPPVPEGVMAALSRPENYTLLVRAGNNMPHSGVRNYG